MKHIQSLFFKNETLNEKILFYISNLLLHREYSCANYSLLSTIKLAKIKYI